MGSGALSGRAIHPACCANSPSNYATTWGTRVTFSLRRTSYRVQPVQGIGAEFLIQPACVVRLPLRLPALSLFPGTGLLTRPSAGPSRTGPVLTDLRQHHLRRPPADPRIVTRTTTLATNPAASPPTMSSAAALLRGALPRRRRRPRPATRRLRWTDFPH